MHTEHPAHTAFFTWATMHATHVLGAGGSCGLSVPKASFADKTEAAEQC